jgi:hypothetical protein
VHIKKIARVLAIHGCDQLAPIDFLRRQQRKFQIGHQCIAGRSRQRARLDWMNGAAQHRVDLDLDG